ncbi:flagellar export chaperone FliS [Paenibacillus chitinolyticus]|uniref:flagellar export chaperone FliS n=1 Tax=Paenibacillus chitinolyticus TaxID=79263 RepID=UPI001C446928|nr:flagellar export chaperone FliS [Paenibacillus chitinolyticus]MBV6716779.1 flagellar export chaperone FliS [Paenibacillus chitinolyticus]
MIASNYREQYLKTKVETASPGDLTLLLYEELYRKLNMAKMNFENQQFEEMLDRIHGARAILYELVGTLNFDYEISNQLRDLYVYYLSLLNEFAIKRNCGQLEEVIEFSKEFSITWKTALNMTKSGQGLTK